jgi:PKD repeat protein
MRLSILIALLVLQILTFAQCPETNPNCGATNNWIVGDSMNLKWNGISLIPTLSRQNQSLESTSSFSDINGNLLFYTDGLNVYNSNDSIMITKLLGNKSATQGSIIVPIDTFQFRVFTTPFTSKLNSFRPLSWSGIYLNKDSLDIQNSNIIIMNNSSEKLQACLSANNKTNFLVAHDDFNSYYSFISKKAKLIDCPIISKSGIDLSVNFPSQQGQMKISPSGKHIALATHYLKTIDFGEFNNEDGVVTVKKTWNFDEAIYGLEFSSNERFIYATLEKSKLVQIDTYNDSIKVIGQIKNSAFVGIQKSPSNKIYIARVLEPYLDVIEFPDSAGMACGFVQKAVTLPANLNYGLPNFNASYFYTPSIDFAYIEDCWGHSYAFEGRDTLQATSWKWLFKDVRNETIEVRQGKNVNYTFPHSDSLENKYEVSHIAGTSTRSDTVTKTLTIRPKFVKDILGKDTFYCAPFPPKGGQADTTHFALNLIAPPNMHCVHWNGEEPNLDESLGAIVDYDHFHTDTLRVDTAGTYIVKLTNKTFCQMWDTLVVEEKPRPNKPAISRADNQLISTMRAAKYQWYFNGTLKLTTPDSKLDPDSNGYWQVQLVSEYGCESELSDSFLVGFASIDDLGFRMYDLGFSIYPNPSDGKVTIELSHTERSRSVNGSYAVSITDFNGKRVYIQTSKNSKLITLDLKLMSGSYIITLTDENGQSGSKQITIN